MDKDKENLQLNISVPNENNLQNIQDLNTGMIMEPVKVKKESSDSELLAKRRKQSEDDEKLKMSAKSISNSVFILPTPNSSPILVEDSQLTGTSQPEDKSYNNGVQKELDHDTNATYCPGFTQDPVNLLPAPKKRSRDAVKCEENDREAPEESPKRTFVKFTCKECEEVRTYLK